MLQHIDHDIMKGVSITAAHERAIDFAYEQHNQAELQYLSLRSLLQQSGQQSQQFLRRLDSLRSFLTLAMSAWPSSTSAAVSTSAQCGLIGCTADVHMHSA